MLGTRRGHALEERTCSQGTQGPCHSNSSVASTPVGGLRTFCPSPGTISILEPRAEFQQCYNELLSAPAPPPPTLLSWPLGSHWLPGWRVLLLVDSMDREVHRRGDPDVGNGTALPSSLHRCPLPSDIIFHPWKKEENGNQSRVILYTITLTNPLAPKTATVRETQVSPKRSEVAPSGPGSSELE